ncbi:NAD(P)-binding protein [Rhizobium sp. TH2]|uniref:NAD(P)-binding protein n=1 Tax=Rhizobium sp. TH2 TaxID=2775403 RepID=UPI0021584ACB|nr:NAD(P)-binding protein [Rhizobium sp. TH2]UVC07740.1 NAD(P)-binding protein [Rhizobium sp. TH2]
MERFDAIVLGAGISGMTAASVIKEKGARRILVLDEYAHLGGNHVSLDIGPYTYDIGSFIFHDDAPFIQKFPGIREKYHPYDGATGRLDFHGNLVRYPFDYQSDLLKAGLVEVAWTLASLLRGRLTRNPDRSARDFVCYWLGERFAKRTGLLSYLTRFYGTGPERIEGEFARKRMRWISQNASFAGQLRRLVAPRRSHARSLVRPRGGFSELYEPAGDALRATGVDIRLGEHVQSIHRDGSGALVIQTDSGIFSSSTVFSTVPLDVVSNWCGLPANPSIRYATLTSLFYSFRGQRNFPFHILYNFSDEGGWKRLTMHSDCYGQANGREYFSVEVIAGDPSPGSDVLAASFQDHVRRRGILLGDLTLEGARETTSAYPIYLKGAGAAAAQAISDLKAIGILSFGRQGGFDYQPTSHISAITAEHNVLEFEAERRGRLESKAQCAGDAIAEPDNTGLIGSLSARTP